MKSPFVSFRTDRPGPRIKTASRADVPSWTGNEKRNFPSGYLYGPLRLCQAILPAMRRNHYGRIVNVSSAMGSLTKMGGGYAAYRTSKAALSALTRILTSETMGTNIRINSTCPGWVRTDMGGMEAERSAEKRADTAVWLAHLPDGGPP